MVESEVYERSYGEHVLDHVDVVQLEPTQVAAQPQPPKGDADHHVTTERLKRQFEERLAGRRRRRGPG
jgi:hypothetical protein